MKRSEIFFAALLPPLDFLMLVGGFIVAYYLRNSGVLFTPDTGTELVRVLHTGSAGDILPFAQFMRYVLYITPAMLIIFGLTGLYAMRGPMPWSKRLVRIFLGVSVGQFFIMLLFLLRNEFFLPRSTVLYAWITCTVFVLFGRLFVRYIQWFLRRRGIGVIRVGVIGASKAAQTIAQSFATAPHALYRLDSRYDSLDVCEVIKQLGADNLDELIVVNEHYNSEDLIRIRNHCLEHQVSFNFVPSFFSNSQSNYVLRNELGLPIIEVKPTPLDGWGRILKRVFDILASSFFIMLFSPIFLIIAVWMKLNSPGPLIYKNVRLGKDMQQIIVWKFRSMRIEYCDGPGYKGGDMLKKYLAANPAAAAEWKATSKLKNDPRVSSVGKFLRKTSLDELPQLFNVFLGTLSLVGPRPIVRNAIHDEVEKYGEAARLLFTVKPGVTGLWQVSGRNNTTFEERIALDIRYIEDWSIWLDIVILFKTIGVFLPGKGKGM